MSRSDVPPGGPDLEASGPNGGRGADALGRMVTMSVRGLLLSDVSPPVKSAWEANQRKIMSSVFIKTLRSMLQIGLTWSHLVSRAP